MGDSLNYYLSFYRTIKIKHQRKNRNKLFLNTNYSKIIDKHIHIDIFRSEREVITFPE